LSGSVRPSVLNDCYVIAENIREDDRRELLAMSGEEPLEAMVSGFIHSDKPRTVLVGDTPVAMFGSGEFEPGVGTVWLLGTKGIEDISMYFLRESKYWLEHLHENYDLLFNYVDERNTVHIKWLKWLGFTFISRHEKFGVENRPFFEFVRIN
jgi:hypothetical protein